MSSSKPRTFEDAERTGAFWKCEKLAADKEIERLQADNERLMHHVRASPSLSNAYVNLAETEIDAQRRRANTLQDELRALKSSAHETTERRYQERLLKIVNIAAFLGPLPDEFQILQFELTAAEAFIEHDHGLPEEPTTRQPERPVAWYRWGGSALRPIIAWGDWPPPEPDDTAWYPLYRGLAAKIERECLPKNSEQRECKCASYCMVAAGAKSDPPVKCRGLTGEDPGAHMRFPRR